MEKVIKVADPFMCWLPGMDVRPNDPYFYVSSLIESLSYAKSGPRRTDDAGDDLLEQMKASKLAAMDYEEAVKLVAGYGESTNPMISVHARLAESVYRKIIQLDSEFRQLLITSLDDRTLLFEYGSFSDQVGTIGAEKNQTWKILLRVSQGAAFVLISKPSGEDKRLRSLVLTEKQRQCLKDDIEEKFGKAATQGLYVGQSSADAAAAGLYQYVNGSWPAKGAE